MEVHIHQYVYILFSQFGPEDTKRSTTVGNQLGARGAYLVFDSVNHGWNLVNVIILEPQMLFDLTAVGVWQILNTR